MCIMLTAKASGAMRVFCTQAPTARPLAPVMSVLGGNALAVALAASVLRGT